MPDNAVTSHRESVSPLSRYLDLLRISAWQVFRQRKRYMGVVLAIALSTAVIIVVLSMGRAVRQFLNDNLQLLGGSTIIKVSYDKAVYRDDMLKRPVRLEFETVDALRQIPGVRSAVLLNLNSVSTNWRDRTLRHEIRGADENYWDVNGLAAKYGTLFTRQDVEDRRKVCVLAEPLSQKIFGTDNSVGELLPIGDSLFEVLGILDESELQNLSDSAIIPITVYQERFEAFWERVAIRSQTIDDVEAIAAAVPGVVAQHQTTEGLSVSVAGDQLQVIRRVLWWVGLFILVSVAGAFTLGGMGILNGMLAAVKARTREIGLKKAMGAGDFDIMVQFLSEAVFLSVGSAILGIGMGRIGIEISCLLLDTRPDEHLFLITTSLSLAFSILLGIVAGYYPARKAARMEVVSAIRYEG